MRESWGLGIDSGVHGGWSICAGLYYGMEYLMAFHQIHVGHRLD